MKIIVTNLNGLRANGMVLADGIKVGATQTTQATLWRYSSGWSPVVCLFRGIESIGSGVGVAGQRVTFVNDEVARSNATIVASELHFEVAEPIGQSPPFLLLPSAIGAPACRSARVRLHFSCLAEFPDVQAEYEFSRGFNTNWAEALPEFPEIEAPSAYSEERLAEAKVATPAAGLWLPFEAGSIQGAMRLGARRSEGVFDAVLYVDCEVGSLVPGTLLRRRVTWTAFEGGECSAEADIATVLELL